MTTKKTTATKKPTAKKPAARKPAAPKLPTLPGKPGHVTATGSTATFTADCPNCGDHTLVAVDRGNRWAYYCPSCSLPEILTAAGISRDALRKDTR